MIIYAEGAIYTYPFEDIGKIEITELNYQESLYWKEKVETDINEIEEVKPGDIIFNRIFMDEIAHWYLIRLKYF